MSSSRIKAVPDSKHLRELHFRNQLVDVKKEIRRQELSYRRILNECLMEEIDPDAMEVIVKKFIKEQENCEITALEEKIKGQYELFNR